MAAITVLSILDTPLNIALLCQDISTDGKPRPLFMHFSGPTGVGKTLTADIVANAVLSHFVTVPGTAPDKMDKKDMLCGKMAVQMRAFVSTQPRDIGKNKIELRYIAVLVASLIHGKQKRVLSRKMAT